MDLARDALDRLQVCVASSGSGGGVPGVSAEEGVVGIKEFLTEAPSPPPYYPSSTSGLRALRFFGKTSP
jgi:hypothetical protein